jgi:hypothetical protein
MSVWGHGSLRGRIERLMMVFGGGSSPMSYAGCGPGHPMLYSEIDQPPSRRDCAPRVRRENSDQAVASFVH